MKDLMGIEIKAGDFIAYPTRSGSCLWMSVAKVVEVTTSKQRWSGDERPCLKVQVRKSSRGWRKMTNKIVTLHRVDNVVVIKQMPCPVCKGHGIVMEQIPNGVKSIPCPKGCERMVII